MPSQGSRIRLVGILVIPAEARRRLVGGELLSGRRDSGNCIGGKKIKGLGANVRHDGEEQLSGRRDFEISIGGIK